MLYFAYGSNLDLDRMVSRCPSAEVVGKAILSGYRLTFMENNGGRMVANILKNKEREVEGIVYSIIEKDFKELDRYEGHPYVYERIDVRVWLEEEHSMVRCYTYKMARRMKFYTEVIFDGRKYLELNSRNRKEGIPKKEYFNHILTGYKQFELNMESIAKYIEEVCV